MLFNLSDNSDIYCVKSVQIRSYFWSVFSCIRTEYRPEITPYLDTFHAVIIHINANFHCDIYMHFENKITENQ